MGSDFRRSVFEYDDLGGHHIARFVGSCVWCNVRTYATDDGSDDPRGMLGDHAAMPFDPTEYGATGDNVPCCFMCQNDTERKYRSALQRAKTIGHWQYSPAVAIERAEWRDNV